MTLPDYLSRIIADATTTARRTHRGNFARLTGALEGLEACRGRTFAQLGSMHRMAARRAGRLRCGEGYWRASAKRDAIGWVLDCTAAALGKREGVLPSVRGRIKAAVVLGAEKIEGEG